ncbi:DUF6691 family protein [Peredibacter starrii]|uniref:DUF6691 family protein n=1 Tax=Peredibacter starrii TaxID=28202 RepID=A0AAX4HU73_9BACT|nr:DUF6691 family protein [Peredibacter starrii]WPU66787.1 DUF6691 family protein [Peredibacter starrii]
MKNVVALLSGLIFAMGLGLSGMTRPDVVKGFLDITGEWNWSLMGVMFGAILVHSIAYQLIMKRKSPILEKEFYLPTKTSVDSRLIIGSIIFGIGWGWGGICPGPAIVNLASGSARAVIFVLFMLLGMKVFQWFDNKVLSK